MKKVSAPSTARRWAADSDADRWPAPDRSRTATSSGTRAWMYSGQMPTTSSIRISIAPGVDAEPAPPLGVEHEHPEGSAWSEPRAQRVCVGQTRGQPERVTLGRRD